MNLEVYKSKDLGDHTMTDTFLKHYGVKRRSGRYPWGSGGDLIEITERLAGKGLSEKDIANGVGMTVQQLRNQKSLAKAELKEAQRINVTRQKEGGMSTSAISSETGLATSTIRDLLKPAANLKYRIVKQISDKLRGIIDESRFVDIGTGVEAWLGVSDTKLNNAVTLLKNDGYKIYYLYQEQLGATGGKKTTIKVLGHPDSTYGELLANKPKIAIPEFFSDDGGVTWFEPSSINNFSSDKVLVKYANDGGALKDGLIEMRKGVPELNLGGKSYAQIRIGVDGTHYMKGMAIMRDDLPDGVDIIYNTSAKPTGNKLDAMKIQEVKGVSKFGSIVKPNLYVDADGKEQFGVVNIIAPGELAVEGTWATYRKNLSSQVLSKQSPRLAEQQLDIILRNAKSELDDISKLTDPTVRGHLLTEFSDKVDKAAIDLRAAALPRQTTNVLLPDPNLKDNEIYAPNYRNGESVVVLRYPHGGTFEIPTLTVNNKTSEYRKLIGVDASDAVAVNPKVAQKLSGADFDGDFVMVIPNKNNEIRTTPSLKDLERFDPKNTYPKYPGMKVIGEEQKQREMGNISNLVTDMTIKGASQDEIARAVRHSMVVIDSAKHELNYRQSAIDNGISALKERYQGSARSGAATLISRTKSEFRVLQRFDHYEIDPKTGKKIFTNTGKTYINKKTGEEVSRMTVSKKGIEKDAYDLSSGTFIEKVYADHANSMKAVANEARLRTLNLTPRPYSPTAKKTYANEVASLDAKYTAAVKARPVERKAQLLGAEIYKAKLAADPGMSRKDKQTWKGRSLVIAQTRLESKKPLIDITRKEWTAIEVGAISPTRLRNVLRNADMDRVRAYATPRAAKAGLSASKTSRALRLLSAGYTTAEISSALGVPVTQIQNIDRD